jgi:polyisoprenoid-binding protein YceI
MIFSFLIFNFLLSRIEVLRNIKFGVYGTALSTFMLLSVGAASFSMYDFEFSLHSTTIWILPIIGTLIFVTSELLSGIFSQFVGFETRASFQQLIQLFLLSIALFVGFFLASYFGLFLIALGYIASSFYREDQTANSGFSLLILSLTPFLSTLAGLDVIDVSIGKNLFGLMSGFAGIWFLYVLAQSKVNPIAFSMIGYILHLVFSVVIIIMGTQKADLGGIDTYLAYLVGSALALTVYHDFKLTQLVYPSLLGIGMYFGPKAPETISPSNKKDSVTENVPGKAKSKVQKDSFSAKGLSIDELVGEYEIISSSSIVNFSLGPKGGITSGKIQGFTGSVKIDEKTGSSLFSVTLPVKKLTTNNELRDESLMEKAYFNVGKYPSMKFKSKKLISKNDYYELDGDFTMIGESNPLKVQVKYIGSILKDGVKTPQFIGKASINRTNFGMKADSKEGNIVDFEFTIELKKKAEKEAKKSDAKPKKKGNSADNRGERSRRNSD